MQRLTYEDIKNPVAEAMGWCATDPRNIAYINRAQEELWYSIKSNVGKHTRMRVSVNKGYLTWPRAIETIEAMSLCRENVPLRSGWFEFLDFGTGQLDNESCASPLMLDRWDSPLQDEIRGSDKKIRLIPDVAETTSMRIEGRNYSSTQDRVIHNNNYNTSGYGEVLSLAFGSVTSTNYFSIVEQVTKEVTNGHVRVYEYDDLTGVQRLISVLEPDETRPVYRRSLVTGICGCTGSECEQVIIVGKKRFIPVKKDSDWMMIPMLQPIIDMAQSIKLREDGDNQRSEIFRANAIRNMMNQFQHWSGFGTRKVIRFSGLGTSGAHRNIQ